MIKVLATGINASVQDGGRFGFRRYGVPVSGFMDTTAANYANYLVGNALNTALIEFAFIGPTLQFEIATKIAITAVKIEPTINGQKIPQATLVTVQPGDLLKLGHVRQGVFGYLAIGGGINSERVLGSQCYYPALYEKNALKKDAQLIVHPESKPVTQSISPLPDFATQEITVHKGPEFHQLSEGMQNVLLESPIQITSSINRMGYVLQSSSTVVAPEIISAPVQPGTVQLTPSGQLIALMRDAQTTGGYARILQLTDTAVGILAQKRPRETIQFFLKE